MSQEATTLAPHIQYAQYAAVKGALKLEKIGLTRRGGKLRKPWALKLGLKASAPYDVVIAELQRRMDEILGHRKEGLP